MSCILQGLPKKLEKALNLMLANKSKTIAPAKPTNAINSKETACLKL